MNSLATRLSTTALYVVTGANPSRGGMLIRQAHAKAIAELPTPPDPLLAAALALGGTKPEN